MQRKIIKDTEAEERNLRLAADLSDLKLAYFHLRKDYQKNENELRELKISFEKLKVKSMRRERDLLKRLWKTQMKKVVDCNGLEKESK